MIPVISEWCYALHYQWIFVVKWTIQVTDRSGVETGEKNAQGGNYLY